MFVTTGDLRNSSPSSVGPGAAGPGQVGGGLHTSARRQRPAKSGEDVVEGDRLEVAAADDIEQLAETVGDGGQVGVANHDLLGLK